MARGREDRVTRFRSPARCVARVRRKN